MKIRIAHLSTSYHTAILLMARPDLASAVGADLDWRLFGTGPAIMQAFARGELDLAYIGLPPAIIGIAGGTRAVCIAGGHLEGTVMAGRSIWKDAAEAGGIPGVLAQFEGKRIGVPGTGSIHDVILKDCIARHAAGRGIEVVNYPWADLVTEAVVKDEVAAAFGTPCLAAAIARFASGKVLVPPSLLWPGNPSYGIVASRAFLDAARDRAVRFLAAHERAEEVLRADPDGAARSIAGVIGVVDEAFVRETLGISPHYCAQLSEEFIASSMAFARTLATLGYLTRTPEQRDVFDPTLIAEVHPAGDHYRMGA